MLLLPAIDLRDGAVVRLRQGDFDAETRYGTDPVATAVAFGEAGAAWVHVVDLDAARTGRPVNRPVVGAICAACPARVQVGGGVRTEADAAALADLGAARVVVGTVAAEDPDLTRAIAARVPVTLGLDVRGSEVAVRGWTESSGRPLDAVLADHASTPGVEAVAVTRIERDGTLDGPDLDGLARLLALTDLAVIASGGVGTVDHLRALADLEVDGRRLSGVIVGTALHDGRLTLADALAATGPCP